MAGAQAWQSESSSEKTCCIYIFQVESCRLCAKPRGSEEVSQGALYYMESPYKLSLLLVLCLWSGSWPRMASCPTWEGNSLSSLRCWKARSLTLLQTKGCMGSQMWKACMQEAGCNHMTFTLSSSMGVEVATHLWVSKLQCSAVQSLGSPLLPLPSSWTWIISPWSASTRT